MPSNDSERVALDAATLARCGYIPCFCPDDPRQTYDQERCPKHGTAEARERWLADQRPRTEAIVAAYLAALPGEQA